MTQTISVSQRNGIALPQHIKIKVPPLAITIFKRENKRLL